MHRGYVALWRKFQDHEFWQERRTFSRAEAWIDILWECQHSKKESTIIIKGVPYKCGYGQSLKAIKTWASRWKWSRGKVHRFFILLENENMISFKTDTKTTTLTVSNYASYDPREIHGGHQTDIKRTSNGHQTDTDNNVKNDNKNISRTRGKRFQPPTEKEAQRYIDEYSKKHRVDPGFDGTYYVNWNKARGWKLTTGPVKDWEAQIRTWIDKRKRNQQQQRIEVTDELKGEL